MQIKTSDINPQTNISVETIGIAPNPTDPTRTYMLHCTHCGKDRNQIQGKISRIIAWHEPTVDAQIITRCTRCGNMTTTQTAPYVKRVLVRISKIDRSSFYCPICARRVMLDEEDCPRCNTLFDFRIMQDEDK